MNLNFELILFYAVVISGLITLADSLFFAKRRKKARLRTTCSLDNTTKLPWLIDHARSFFPILLMVFFFRSFLYEPFRIPSGSLEPTLAIGDFILVNKFAYGLRLPVWHKKIWKNAEPQHGDIVVFRWPPNPTVNFIKRIIGVPGDSISYINKVLYVNGKEVPQQFVMQTTSQDEDGKALSLIEKEEVFFGVHHAIYQNPQDVSTDFNAIQVPEGMYFAMGDNRDNSADSRAWGFVPEENVVGKAVAVWMSWDAIKHRIRWHRLMHSVH